MKFSRRTIVGILLILIFFFIIFFIHANNQLIEQNNLMKYSTSLDSINERVRGLSTEINNFPRSVKDDLFFLSHLVNLKNLVNGKGDKSLLEQDFLEFIKQSGSYYQIRSIDETGQEIVRVESKGPGKEEIISSKNLQNKKNRYYFKESIKLKEGELYISKLDLNIEKGELEDRGSKENPIYVPVIRYATPIFNFKGIKKGIVITNVYGESFLRDISNFQRQGEEVYLINQEGYYLYNKNKSKEFSFMFKDKDYNFFNDYPYFPRNLLEKKDKIFWESKGKIFTYRFISPILGNSKETLDNSSRNHFWVLITVTNKSDIDNPLKIKQKLILENYFLLVAILLIIISLFYILEYK